MDPDILYHYTSLDALVSILDSEDENITLRATQAKFFNDFKECDHICDILSTSNPNFPIGIHSIDKDNSINGILEDLKNSFIVSFSKSYDDLNMWRGYGTNGMGIAIGFDVKKLNSFDYLHNFILIQCNYNTKSIIENWEKLYHLYNTKNEKGELVDLTLSFLVDAISAKNSSFQSEKEWRLSTFDKINYKIKFRSTGKTIIPYIEHKIPKGYIKEIIIGPCLNEELIKDGIIQMLQQRNFDLSKIKVKTSKVPFRQL